MRTNPFKYAEGFVDSIRTAFGFETLPKFSDSKVRSICSSIATVGGVSLIAAGSYLEKKEATEQLRLENEAAAASQKSAQDHELAILREKHRHDLDKQFFSYSEKSNSQKTLPEESYKTKDFSKVLDEPPIIE